MFTCYKVIGGNFVQQQRMLDLLKNKKRNSVSLLTSCCHWGDISLGVTFELPIPAPACWLLEGIS